MHQVAIPAFIRGLNVLASLLEKATAQAQETGVALDTLISARLAPDMHPLPAQIQRASDSAKLAAERLTGVKSPRFEDNESTFPELQKRIADTIAYLETVKPEQFEGSETRTVTLNFGKVSPTFQGDDYLLSFALPNFYFHVTAAYAILRNNGINIGKLDYLGPIAPPAGN
jgi:hypothetical protein